MIWRCPTIGFLRYIYKTGAQDVNDHQPRRHQVGNWETVINLQQVLHKALKQRPNLGQSSGFYNRAVKMIRPDDGQSQSMGPNSRLSVSFRKNKKEDGCNVQPKSNRIFSLIKRSCVYKGRSPPKKTGKCGNFENTWGGVYPNPTSIFYCF